MNAQTLEIAFKKGFVKCAMEKYAFGVQDISNFLTDYNIDPQWAGAGVGALGGGLLGGLLGPKGHTGKSMLLGALGGGFGGYYGGGKFNKAFPGHPLGPYRVQVKNSPQDQQALSPLKSLEDPSLIQQSSGISPYDSPAHQESPSVPMEPQYRGFNPVLDGSNTVGGMAPNDHLDPAKYRSIQLGQRPQRR